MSCERVVQNVYDGWSAPGGAEGSVVDAGNIYRVTKPAILLMAGTRRTAGTCAEHPSSRGHERKTPHGGRSCRVYGRLSSSTTCSLAQIDDLWLFGDLFQIFHHRIGVIGG